jgi:hypothetical protein
MPQPTNPKTIHGLERSILCALCGSVDPRASRAALARELDAHTWQEVDHRVVYQALGRLQRSDPQPLRQQLAVAATRMGFPDVDWDDYFAPSGIADADLPELVRQLVAITVREP